MKPEFDDDEIVESNRLLSVLGYLFSFLFPIIGIFIGFYLHKKENKNGKFIIVFSLIVLLIMLIIPWASKMNLEYYYYYL